MKTMHCNLFRVLGTLLLFLGLSANAQGLVAANDYAHLTPGVANASVIDNILANDTFFGTPVTLSSNTLTVVSQSSPFVGLSGTAVVTSFPGGVQEGVYTIVYQVCRISAPANCSTATVTVSINNCTPPVVTGQVQPLSFCISSGSIVFSNLPPQGWALTLVRDNMAISNYSGTGTSTTVSNLTSTSVYKATVTNTTDGCISSPAYFLIPAYTCGLDAALTGSYQDFNNDGIPNAGDRINYSITLTNNIAPGFTLSPVAVSPAGYLGISPIVLSATQISSLPYQVPNTAITGYCTISQEDVNAGYVRQVIAVTGYRSSSIYDGWGVTVNDLPLAQPPASAVLSGNATLCSGQSSNLQVAVTGGTAPYTIAYSDGSATTTVNNYTSGASIAVMPNADTTYSLVSVTDANGLAAGTLSGQALISVQQQYPFYADLDADGSGSGTVQWVCADAAAPAPAGYATNNLDCDDTNAQINPSHAEVLYNGLDDNCDGQLDEGNQITTALLQSVCNTTLSSINTLIGITTLAPAAAYTGWRIRLTNGGQVQTIEKNVPHFMVTEFPTFTFGTTYTVAIELQRNGVWLGYYGPSCAITTPSEIAGQPASQVSQAQCGVTLARINTLIATVSLPNCNGYRFRVTDLTAAANSNTVQVIDRTQNWFSLPMLAQYNYGTVYQVEVAVKIGTGSFGNYGDPCQVTSPDSPSLINCNATITAMNTLIAASSLAGATQYRFELTRAADNTSITIDRSVNYFTFNNIPASAFTAGGVYSVRVAVMTANAWSPFGNACVITAPGAATRPQNAEAAYERSEVPITVKIAPNPFSSQFRIDATLASAAPIQVKVYDLLGRLMEDRVLAATELDGYTIGQAYPAGVYNLILLQDGIVTTVRVVKRQ